MAGKDRRKKNVLDAKKHVDDLYNEIEKRPAFANRYLFIMRKLAMKMRFPLPKRYKQLMCPYCYAYWPTNPHVRVKQGRPRIRCPQCGKHFTK
ncbi:MAG: hypothetical protein H6502_04025 [Candidatus Woesearchaeota archaeon]|nr:MAG: hypothetical protein H6502_04025 [Candidatus Woesearchaeota archaeon]